MMLETYLDCYGRLDGTRLTVGNSLIERVFEVDLGGVIPLCVTDKRREKEWKREGEYRRMGLPFGVESFEVSACVEDNGGLSAAHYALTLSWKDDGNNRFERMLTVFPGLPFVSMQTRVYGEGVWMAPQDNAQMTVDGNENAYSSKVDSQPAQRDCIDVVPMPQGHYKLHTTYLLDKSDQNDSLARESVRPLYSSGWGNEWEEGNVFVVEDYVNDQAFLLAKEAPFPMSALSRTQGDAFFPLGRSAQLVGSGLDGQAVDGEGIWGYGSTVGVGTADELPGLYRALYKAVWNRAGGALIMSNTWGDRSQDKAVCHDFMMQEIEKAAYLGADIVQIDDGWQHGHTANSALKKGGVWEGYYKADPDFWTVNLEKFPQGLKPLVERAAENGIELGLWFSPDSTDDFACWRKDADTLLKLWKSENIRHFKLDGVSIRSKLGERNYLRFLEAVSFESGGKLWVNQDITAQVRLGSLYFKQYGNLFVENRYTDTGAYYPHHTLKNLWSMCRLVPPAKLQFESLNPRRNIDKYPADDPFKPSNYSMDYLFATTMLASPLLWMEMSHLGEEDSRRLKSIIEVMRAHRDQIAQGDVRPIGDMPDGQSLTGFMISCGDAEGYLLLFREATARDTFVCQLPAGRIQADLLACGAETAVKAETDGQVEVTLTQERSFAFIKWSAAKG